MVKLFFLLSALFFSINVLLDCSDLASYFLIGQVLMCVISSTFLSLSWLTADPMVFLATRFILPSSRGVKYSIGQGASSIAIIMSFGFRFDVNSISSHSFVTIDIEPYP